jgi:phospholipid/cholesterol/gamma-HCH transport system substrate-binding protein
MSRSLSRWQAVLLGVVVLLGLGLTGGGLFAVGNRQWLWSDTFHVRAGFKQIRGIEVGTRVRIQGIEAGEVVDVEPPLTPGGDVVVRMRIAGRLRHLVRADASVQIVSEGMIGGKVVEIHPGTLEAEPVLDNAVLASRPSPEFTEVLGQVSSTLQGIRDGEGTLGKLVKDREAYDAVVKLIQQSQDTVSSLKQDADALKQLPIVRSYVEDPHALLVRPNCECNRRCFAEVDLFEPGRAVLTGEGKKQLDYLSPWLAGLKQKGSEVVIVCYADSKAVPDAAYARTLTKQQSEAVLTYLKDQHSVHKLGWFSSRKVTALGCGTARPPVPEKEPLPAARVEVLVFVPQA